MPPHSTHPPSNPPLSHLHSFHTVKATQLAATASSAMNSHMNGFQMADSIGPGTSLDVSTLASASTPSRPTTASIAGAAKKLMQNRIDLELMLIRRVHLLMSSSLAKQLSGARSIDLMLLNNASYDTGDRVKM